MSGKKIREKHPQALSNWRTHKQTDTSIHWLQAMTGRVKTCQIQKLNYVAFCSETVYGYIQGPIRITVMELIKGGLYCLMLMHFLYYAFWVV